MKLEYQVLWFDDQPGNLRGVEDSLRTRLAREGFDLTIRWVTAVRGDVNARLRELLNEDDWDLILVDWDLGEGTPDGAELSKKIRNLFRYTELVFYSAESPAKLRRLIFDKGVDGVYCAQRGDALKTAAWGVVQTTIRKVLDLNHMRGVVMAAVADLDHEIDDCLQRLYEKIAPTDKEDLVAHIVEKMKEVADTNSKQMGKLASEDFGKLLKHRAFSSNLKQLTLQYALKKLSEKLTAALMVEKLSFYLDDVIHPRNTFAHERVVREKKKLLFPTRQIEIDFDTMADIRRKLLSHRDNLSDIIRVLTEWQGHEVPAEVQVALDRAVGTVDALQAATESPDENSR